MIPDEVNESDKSYLKSCTSNTRFKDLMKDSGLDDAQIANKQKNALCYPNHIDKTLLTSLEDNKAVTVLTNYSEMLKLYEIYNSKLFIVVLNSFEINLDSNSASNPFKLLIKESWMTVEPSLSKMMYVKVQTFVGSADRTKFVFSEDNPKFYHHFIDSLEAKVTYENTHRYPPDLQILDSSLFIMLVNNQMNTETSLYYKSIDEVLGNIGGLYSIILPFVEVLFGFCVDPFYQASRVNSVFKFHENLSSKEEVNEVIEKFINNANYSNSRKSIDEGTGDLGNNIIEERIVSSNNSPKIISQLSNMNNNEINLPIIRNSNGNNDNNQEVLNNQVKYKEKSLHYEANELYINIDVNKDDNNSELKKIYLRKETNPEDRELKEFSIKKNPNIPYNKQHEIQYIIKKKKVNAISCLDICKAKCSSNDNDAKGKIIEKCLDYLDSTLNEHFIGINSIKYNLLLKSYIDAEQQELFKVPSINTNIEDNSFLDELEQELGLEGEEVADNKDGDKKVNNSIPDIKQIEINTPNEESNKIHELELVSKLVLKNTSLNQNLIRGYLKSNL